MPDAWLVSRICEEFACTPLEAVQQPLGLVLEIMDLRAYAQTKQAVEQHKQPHKALADGSLRWTPLVDEVLANRRVGNQARAARNQMIVIKGERSER